MSGEGKRGDAARPKQPRPSSTLLLVNASLAPRGPERRRLGGRGAPDATDLRACFKVHRPRPELATGAADPLRAKVPAFSGLRVIFMFFVVKRINTKNAKVPRRAQRARLGLSCMVPEGGPRRAKVFEVAETRRVRRHRVGDVSEGRKARLGSRLGAADQKTVCRGRARTSDGVSPHRRQKARLKCERSPKPASSASNPSA